MKIFLVLILLISNQVYSEDSIVEQDRELMRQYMCKPNLLEKLVNDPHVDVNDKGVLGPSDGTGMKYASYLYLAVEASRKCPNEAFKSVRVLLENGADPNLHGTSAVLFSAIQAIEKNRLFNLLLNNGADPNIPLPPGIQNSYLPNLWLFYVNNSLTLHWSDKDFLSDLQWGVELLKNHGVDINSTTVAGQNALHLAATTSRSQPVEPDSTYPVISEVEVNKILIKLGVSIDKKDVNGLRPLDWVYLLYNHNNYTCTNIKKVNTKYNAPGSRYYIERQKDAEVYLSMGMIERELPGKFNCILYRKYK
ncbi:hypothetical protein SOD_p00530 (plasmid) [Serratia plymuthica 4Rx13]|uniref:Uncharacterized protein n=1 Tax=Serratia plymuthica TaxID=82996 RepID=A0A318PAU0_SERPL|nr:ankyrin repeat domain-containing protein [Serratia plymuthica]AGO57727.1 hypothetical protein SOD_p00530 [Serratia plymuthica 4Rx13]PYD36617.1 hypothetical protein CT690_24045 [Serratia plymuthica]